MGNWLGSIGQGMQTGDYTGSRLGYQQEMLTKLQNLQAMKRQQQFREQAAQTDFNDPQQVARLAANNPDMAQMIAPMVEPMKTLAQTKQANSSSSLDQAQAAMLDWKKNNPDAKDFVPAKNAEGKVTLHALLENGTYKDTGLAAPVSDSKFQVVGGRLFHIVGDTATEVSPETPKPDTTNNIKEYQFALENGYKGTFQQWMASQKASASGGSGTPKPPQNMPSPVAKELEAGTDLLTKVGQIAAGFNKDYVGNIANGLENTMQKYTNMGTPGQAEWWSSYNDFINQVRHGLFGSALTAQEKDAFDRTIVTGDMKPDLAEKVLKRQITLVAKAWERKYKGNLNAYNPEQVKQWDASGIFNSLNDRGFILANPFEDPQPASAPPKVTGVNSGAPQGGGWKIVGVK
jgi:hypothetical protein